MTRARQTREQEQPAAPALPVHADAAAEPSYDEIARRAYELYLGRGGADGRDVDDWLEAEQELRNGESRSINTD